MFDVEECQDHGYDAVGIQLQAALFVSAPNTLSSWPASLTTPFAWDTMAVMNKINAINVIMSSALANLIRPLAIKLELSALPYHIHHILAAFLLYQGIFLLLSPAISRTLFFPSTYKRLDRRTRVNWDVHVVSTIQSLLINSMAIYVMPYDEERHKAAPTLLHPKTNWRERLWGYSPQAGLVQSFATGYFLWDLAASIEYFDVLGASSLIHAVAALGITSMGYVCSTMHCTIYVLVVSAL